MQDFYIITNRINIPVINDIEVKGWGAVLSWTISSEPQLGGYKILWGTQSGVYTSTNDIGKVNKYLVEPLTYNTTYYFTLVAYDLAGRESMITNINEKQLTIVDVIGRDDCILYNSIVKPKEGAQMELMWKLDVSGEVEIKIYSKSGRFIWGEKKHYSPGPHIKKWDLKKNNKIIGAGTYYVVIKTPKWQKKMLLCIIK